MNMKCENKPLTKGLDHQQATNNGGLGKCVPQPRASAAPVGTYEEARSNRNV